MSKLPLTLVLLVSLAVAAWTQTPTAAVSGKVTDQTGAVIPGATVTATGPDGRQVSATSDQGGGFSLRSLPAGSYTVTATANGFAQFSQSAVTLTPGHTLTLNLMLQVQAQEEKVNVQSETPTQLDVSSSSSAGALVIKGKDLEALSDDPDELSSELQALAGPSAGPSGGQIYIDGFTGGQLPAKSAIREIRVNQNPFSAQYDKLGYGRIEIFTKPGADKLHGQVFFNDNNSVLNSRNPYVRVKPSYNSEMFEGNLSGPINKRASFFLDASRRNMHEYSALNAVDPNQLPNPLPKNVPQQTSACLVIPCIVESIANPRTRTSFSPRVDVQLTTTNTFTARYQLTHDGEQNSGLGTFSLPSVAYNLNETEHTLQLSDTQIVSPKIVNETRFQFQRETNHQLPLGSGPTVDVQQSFTYGQNAQGLVRTTQDNYELQNYTSLTSGKHLIKFGARLRGIRMDEVTNANFNGEFIFSAPPVGSGTLVDPLGALRVYQNATQGLCSGTYDPSNCPSQFMLTIGANNVNVGWMDAGLYAEDEWRVKPNFSLTYGLRFESQNQIHDHADWAPRLGVAWGLGGDGKAAPKTVLRGGFGIFYDRFGYNLIEQATLLNGVTQQKAVVENPNFFSTAPSQWPAFTTLSAQGSPTVYQVSHNLRAPYTMQAAGSIERQITKAATLSVTYLNSRGEHAFYLDNVNAPAPWLCPPSGACGRPLGTSENIYQYQSGGIFRQNQLIVNTRVSAGKWLSLFGFYTLSYANSNAASGGAAGGFFASGGTSSASFVTNQYDPLADYGRAAFDVRHRAFIGGNVSMPYGFSLSPFVIVNSGAPYNITTGQDNNGDSIFNDRPWLTSANESFNCKSRTDFSTAPTGSGEVPINSCTGPGNVTLNLRLSKTFGFGRETKGGGGGGGDFGGRGGPRGGGLGPRGLSGGGGNPFAFGSSTSRHYNLTFSISARNLLNTFNPGNPVANLSSALFGQTLSTGGGPFASASANRRLDLQVRFAF